MMKKAACLAHMDLRKRTVEWIGGIMVKFVEIRNRMKYDCVYSYGFIRKSREP